VLLGDRKKGKKEKRMSKEGGREVLREGRNALKGYYSTPQGERESAEEKKKGAKASCEGEKKENLLSLHSRGEFSRIGGRTRGERLCVGREKGGGNRHRQRGRCLLAEGREA